MLVPLVHGVAVGADALRGVALGPAEADADHGLAEIARGLHEVAGEDAEAARVRGKLLVQSVFHGEVGDERHRIAGSFLVYPVRIGARRRVYYRP